MRVESFFPTCEPAHHFLPLSQKHLRSFQPPGPFLLLFLLYQLNGIQLPTLFHPTVARIPPDRYTYFT